MQYSILESYKEKYIEALKSTNREGINDLLSWLTDETDFFYSPCVGKNPWCF